MNFFHDNDRQDQERSDCLAGICDGRKPGCHPIATDVLRRRLSLCLLTALFTAILLTGLLKLVRLTEPVGAEVSVVSISNPPPFGDDSRSLPKHGDWSISCSNLFFPCLLGNGFGGRQFDGPGCGFVAPLRSPVEDRFTRGAFMLRGDIRPPFGEIRPYLLFLRLRN